MPTSPPATSRRGGGAGHLHRLGPAGGGHQAEGNAQAAQLADTFREGALAPGAAASEGTPDIIFITSESFFDVTRLPGITFERTPCPTSTAWRRPAPTAGACPTITATALETWRWRCSPACPAPSSGRGTPSPPWTRGLCPAAHHRPAAEAGGVCHGVRPRPHQRAVQPRHHPPRHWV